MRILCDFTTGYLSDRGPLHAGCCCWEHSRIILFLVLHFVAFLFLKMLIILIHGFFLFFFLISCLESFLIPRKEGNPFNYCQNLVVRCNVPSLPGASSSCMAAHGDVSPTLAAAKPALCQWLRLSVSLHFRDVKVRSTHWLMSSTIHVRLTALDR